MNKAYHYVASCRDSTAKAIRGMEATAVAVSYATFRRHCDPYECRDLAGIADFVKSQREAEANGETACAACNKRGVLHLDNEDGRMKCYSCCDMPD